MSKVVKYDITRNDYDRIGAYNSYCPEQVGTFAISTSGEFTQCNSAKIPKMKAFKLPLDLNDGYDPSHDYDGDYKNMTILEEGEKPLKWLFETGHDVMNKVNVVTQRGILRDIGNTLHNVYNNPWKFEVCQYGGILYIRKDESKEQEAMSSFGLKHAYFGKRYEKYVMESQDVNAVYKVVTGSIGRHSTLLTAEVDAVMDNGQQVEIKTCFPNKLVQKVPVAWLQSYLGGIDVLHCGMKDKVGWIRQPHKELSMKEVPLNATYMPRGRANTMFGVISDVLDWLQDSIKEDNTIWSFEYKGRNKSVILEKKGEKYLPDWYKEFVDNKQMSSLVKEVDALRLEHPVGN